MGAESLLREVTTIIQIGAVSKCRRSEPVVRYGDDEIKVIFLSWLTNIGEKG